MGTRKTRDNGTKEKSWTTRTRNLEITYIDNSNNRSREKKGTAEKHHTTIFITMYMHLERKIFTENVFYHRNCSDLQNRFFPSSYPQPQHDPELTDTVIFCTQIRLTWSWMISDEAVLTASPAAPTVKVKDLILCAIRRDRF